MQPPAIPRPIKIDARGRIPLQRRILGCIQGILQG